MFLLAAMAKVALEYSRVFVVLYLIWLTTRSHLCDAVEMLPTKEALPRGRYPFGNILKLSSSSNNVAAFPVNKRSLTSPSNKKEERMDDPDPVFQPVSSFAIEDSIKDIALKVLDEDEIYPSDANVQHQSYFHSVGHNVSDELVYIIGNYSKKLSYNISIPIELIAAKKDHDPETRKHFVHPSIVRIQDGLSNSKNKRNSQANTKEEERTSNLYIPNQKDNVDVHLPVGQRFFMVYLPHESKSMDVNVNVGKEETSLSGKPAQDEIPRSSKQPTLFSSMKHLDRKYITTANPSTFDHLQPVNLVQKNREFHQVENTNENTKSDQNKTHALLHNMTQQLANISSSLSHFLNTLNSLVEIANKTDLHSSIFRRPEKGFEPSTERPSDYLNPKDLVKQNNSSLNPKNLPHDLKVISKHFNDIFDGLNDFLEDFNGMSSNDTEFQVNLSVSKNHEKDGHSAESLEFVRRKLHHLSDQLNSSTFTLRNTIPAFEKIGKDLGHISSELHSLLGQLTFLMLIIQTLEIIPQNSSLNNQTNDTPLPDNPHFSNTFESEIGKSFSSVFKDSKKISNDLEKLSLNFDSFEELTNKSGEVSESLQFEPNFYSQQNDSKTLAKKLSILRSKFDSYNNFLKNISIGFRNISRNLEELSTNFNNFVGNFESFAKVANESDVEFPAKSKVEKYEEDSDRNDLDLDVANFDELISDQLTTTPSLENLFYVFKIIGEVTKILSNLLSTPVFELDGNLGALLLPLLAQPKQKAFPTDLGDNLNSRTVPTKQSGHQPPLEMPMVPNFFSPTDHKKYIKNSSHADFEQLQKLHSLLPFFNQSMKGNTQENNSNLQDHYSAILEIKNLEKNRNDSDLKVAPFDEPVSDQLTTTPSLENFYYIFKILGEIIKILNNLFSIPNFPLDGNLEAQFLPLLVQPEQKAFPTLADNLNNRTAPTKQVEHQSPFDMPMTRNFASRTVHKMDLRNSSHSDFEQLQKLHSLLPFLNQSKKGNTPKNNSNRSENYSAIPEMKNFEKNRNDLDLEVAPFDSLVSEQLAMTPSLENFYYICKILGEIIKILSNLFSTPILEFDGNLGALGAAFLPVLAQPEQRDFPTNMAYNLNNRQAPTKQFKHQSPLDTPMTSKEQYEYQQEKINSSLEKLNSLLQQIDRASYTLNRTVNNFEEISRSSAEMPLHFQNNFSSSDLIKHFCDKLGKDSSQSQASERKANITDMSSKNQSQFQNLPKQIEKLANDLEKLSQQIKSSTKTGSKFHEPKSSPQAAPGMLEKDMKKLDQLTTKFKHFSSFIEKYSPFLENFPNYLKEFSEYITQINKIYDYHSNSEANRRDESVLSKSKEQIKQLHNFKKMTQNNFKILYLSQKIKSNKELAQELLKNFEKDNYDMKFAVKELSNIIEELSQVQSDMIKLLKEQVKLLKKFNDDIVSIRKNYDEVTRKANWSDPKIKRRLLKTFYLLSKLPLLNIPVVPLQKFFTEKSIRNDSQYVRDELDDKLFNISDQTCRIHLMSKTKCDFLNYLGCMDKASQKRFPTLSKDEDEVSENVTLPEHSTIMISSEVSDTLDFTTEKTYTTQNETSNAIDKEPLESFLTKTSESKLFADEYLTVEPENMSDATNAEPYFVYKGTVIESTGSPELDKDTESKSTSQYILDSTTEIVELPEYDHTDEHEILVLHILDSNKENIGSTTKYKQDADAVSEPTGMDTLDMIKNNDSSAIFDRNNATMSKSVGSFTLSTKKETKNMSDTVNKEVIFESTSYHPENNTGNVDTSIYDLESTTETQIASMNDTAAEIYDSNTSLVTEQSYSHLMPYKTALNATNLYHDDEVDLKNDAVLILENINFPTYRNKENESYTSTEVTENVTESIYFKQSDLEDHSISTDTTEPVSPTNIKHLLEPTLKNEPQVENGNETNIKGRMSDFKSKKTPTTKHKTTHTSRTSTTTTSEAPQPNPNNIPVFSADHIDYDPDLRDDVKKMFEQSLNYDYGKYGFDLEKPDSVNTEYSDSDYTDTVSLMKSLLEKDIRFLPTIEERSSDDKASPSSFGDTHHVVVTERSVNDEGLTPITYKRYKTEGGICHLSEATTATCKVFIYHLEKGRNSDWSLEHICPCKKPLYVGFCAEKIRQGVKHLNKTCQYSKGKESSHSRLYE